MNSVSYLRKHHKRLTNEQILTIKNLGRPTPDISLCTTLSYRNKQYNRHFNVKLYKDIPWLCGCNEKNALFCFPCLLLGEVKPSMWTTIGTVDLSHLNQNVKRHERLSWHGSNVVSLALLGCTNIQIQLESSYWVNQQNYKERVDENRYTLSRIIDRIKFYGARELSRHSKNCYAGLTNLSVGINNVLHEHLDPAIVSSKETFRSIQHELFKCILQVCREKIAAEVDEARYVALMVDQVTNNIAAQFQISIVLRYIHEGIPVERFWGFKSPKIDDAESLADCILSEIDPLLSKSPSKLIAQTYNGYIMSNGKIKDICTLIRKKYPLAHFVHSYAHQLHSLISQAAWQNNQVRVFFSNINSIISFFSSLPQRTNMLIEIVGTKLPPGNRKKWTESQCISIIYEYRVCLLECVQQLQENFENSKILHRASAIEHLLDDREFLFWVNVFHRIMPHYDELCETVQKEEADDIKHATKTFESCVQYVKENIDEILDANVLQIDNSEPSPKRIRISYENLKKSALEVCDAIIQTTTERFEFLTHLVIASFFNPKRFEKYKSTDIPGETLCTIVEAFPDIVQLDKLISEFSVTYTYTDFKKFKAAVPFMNTLRINNLEKTFEETLKLLELIITIPMSTSEADRCFLTSKNLRHFLRNSMDEEKTPLAMISMENRLMKNDVDFNSKVIERLSNSEQRFLDLSYKKKV